MNITHLCCLGLLSALSTNSFAITFSHKSWLMLCDNTRTCRAEGSPVEAAEIPVSALLTRPAGANTAISLEFQMDSMSDTPPKQAKLSIGQLDLGTIPLETKLSPARSQSLLNEMLKGDKLTLRAGTVETQLSLAGIKAVLLKMDEWQQRVDTPSALIKKGNKPEQYVLPALAKPIIRVAPILPTLATDQKILQAHQNFLDQQCDRFLLGSAECHSERAIYRLSSQKLLLTQLEWQSVYNRGFSFWIVNNTPPYTQKKLALEDGQEFSKGLIRGYQKGRLRGDCYTEKTWAWNGEDFILAEDTFSGSCIGILPGTWHLPRFTSELINPNH